MATRQQQEQGAVITQSLYDAEGRNRKFIPVLFAATDAKYIPHVLRGATYYVVDTTEGYRELYRRLSGQPYVKMPPLGKLVPLSSRSSPDTGHSEPAVSQNQQQQRRSGKLKAANRGAVQRSGPNRTLEKKSAHASNYVDRVLLMTDDGRFTVCRYERMESQDVTRLYVVADDPKTAAFLSQLRQAYHGRLHVAYMLQNHAPELTSSCASNHAADENRGPSRKLRRDPWWRRSSDLWLSLILTLVLGISRTYSLATPVRRSSTHSGTIRGPAAESN
jgi:hypothetical protein